MIHKTGQIKGSIYTGQPVDKKLATARKEELVNGLVVAGVIIGLIIFVALLIQ